MVFSEEPALTPEQKKIIAEIEFTVDANQVEDLLRKFIYQLKNGKPASGTVLKPIEYDIVSRKMEVWIKYRWFIADTSLSRKWLSGIYDLVKYMAKTKRYINAAEFSGNTKTAKYLKAVEYYDVAYKRFINSVQKPVKVSGKVQRKAQLQKVLWQREMRKKYKLKEKQTVPDF